jgi:hypothetical protein
MCVNRIQNDQDDPDDILVHCEAECYEYMEFVALPVYKAAQEMYEVLQYTLGGLKAIEMLYGIDVKDHIKQINQALSKSEGKGV